MGVVDGDTDYAARLLERAQDEVATGIDQLFDRLLAVPADPRGRLYEAMRHAAIAGGKRLRPLLVRAAGDLFHVDRALSLRVGAAVEAMHVYSLIHDDLPCMDDDALRRGRPTTHVVFGEAQGMLAGDALQTLAFEVLAEAAASVAGSRTDPAAASASAVSGLALVTVLARAAGVSGMAGGQSIDLASVGRTLDRSRLETMHRMKTGALLRASVALGAMAAGLGSGPRSALADPGMRFSQPLLADRDPAVDPAAHVVRFADRIGLAFQVVDDVLDVVADSGTLGKTAGKDAANDKPTYVSLLGIDGARDQAARLLEEALAALEPFGSRARRLASLADLIVNRAS